MGVNRRQVGMRCRDQDGEGLNNFAPPILAFPKAGERQRRCVRRFDKERALFPAFAHPLEPSIRGYQAPLPHEGMAEIGPLMHRLGAGVDEPCAHLHVRGPRRQQSPTQSLDGSFAIIFQQAGGEIPRWRAVSAHRRVDRRRWPEKSVQVTQLAPSQSLREASAHRNDTRVYPFCFN